MSDVSQYRIAVFGGGAVGKTSLTTRLIIGKFGDHYDPTLGDECLKDVTADETDMRLEIFDTAGREEFSSVQEEWMRSGDGFLIVYSITSRQTFEEVELIRDKISRAKDEDIEKIPIVIVGNKCDLEEQRQVKKEEGFQFAKENYLPFFETSAKEGINNDECFYEVAREIRRIEQMLPTPRHKKEKKQKNYCMIL